MIKKLDLYIIRKFIGTFVFIITGLIAIAIVIDLTEKISEFVNHHLSFINVAMGYYIYFIPYIGCLLGPFFIFIAVIFFTSQMAGRSEFIAMLAAGIGYNRILVPYLITAAMFAGVLFYANNQVLPRANKARLKFENLYINRVRFNINKKTHKQIGENQFIYVEDYNIKDSTGVKMTLEKFENNRLVYKLHADRMQYITSTKKWRLMNYFERRIAKDGESTSSGITKDTTFLVQPYLLFTEFLRNDEMTTPELEEHIANMKATGTSGAVMYEIEKQRRTASAFSIFIFTIIGVSIASRKIRGGLGFHLIMGIAMCALYEIFMKTTTTFSTNANLPAIIGVWIPNVVYMGVAVFFYKKAQR